MQSQLDLDDNRRMARPRATPQDRLNFKVPRLIEGEAVGRFAIVVLLVTVALRLMLAAGVAATLSWTVAQRLFF